MKNARFIALAEQLLEQKAARTLKSVLEGKKRLRVESDVELDGDEEEVYEEEGAGGTDAARKADDPDKAQADLGKADDDQLHLNEEDDAQLDIDHFDNEGHNGDDLVTTEEGDTFDVDPEEFGQDQVKVDGDDKPVIESEEGEEDELDMFLDEADDELDLDFGDEEEPLAEAKRKRMIRKKTRR